MFMCECCLQLFLGCSLGIVVKIRPDSPPSLASRLFSFSSWLLILFFFYITYCIFKVFRSLRYWYFNYLLVLDWAWSTQAYFVLIHHYFSWARQNYGANKCGSWCRLLTEGNATSGDYGSGKGISNQGEEQNAANNKNNNSSERQKGIRARNCKKKKLLSRLI